MVRSYSVFLAAIVVSASAQPVRPAYEKPLHTVAPLYSDEARAAGLQGSVILYVEVSPEGRVKLAHVIQHLGLGLDGRAVQAVRQWQFNPAVVNGAAIGFEETAEVTFALNDTPSWRVLRADYHVSMPNRIVRPSVDPVLNQFTKPDDAVCKAGNETATVSLDIRKDGKPSHVKVVDSSGERAAGAVSEAVELWRFRPAEMDGSKADATANFVMRCGDTTIDEQTRAAQQDTTAAATNPSVLYKFDPVYSEEARLAKYNGSVVLYVEIDAAGHTTHLRAVRPLGLGLDEKAMAAVSQWRFKPATKSGVPVPTTAHIEVNFRLL